MFAEAIRHVNANRAERPAPKAIVNPDDAIVQTLD